MTTTEQLTQVFNDNFVAYLRSHVAHVNIVGRNFASDHKLLQKVYEDLQEQIDRIAELLRTLDSWMPASMAEIAAGSHMPTTPIEGDADDLIMDVLTDVEHLANCYRELIEIAEEEEQDEIANYAQDRVLALTKHAWMLKATLS
jgi:starvation-inducible DNA-binding protein